MSNFPRWEQLEKSRVEWMAAFALGAWSRVCPNCGSHLGKRRRCIHSLTRFILYSPTNGKPPSNIEMHFIVSKCSRISFISYCYYKNWLFRTVAFACKAHGCEVNELDIRVIILNIRSLGKIALVHDKSIDPSYLEQLICSIFI